MPDANSQSQVQPPTPPQGQGQPPAPTPSTPSAPPVTPTPSTPATPAPDLINQYGGQPQAEGQPPTPSATPAPSAPSKEKKEGKFSEEDVDMMYNAIVELDRLSKLNPTLLNEIEKAKKLSTTPPAPPAAPSISPDVIKKEVDRAVEPIKKIADDLVEREKQKKLVAIRKFEGENPDMFGDTVNHAAVNKNRNLIGGIAEHLVRTGGVSYAEALRQALVAVNPDKAEQVGRDKEQLRQYEKEQAEFSGGGVAGGEPPRDEAPSYSKKELEIADQLDASGKLKNFMLTGKK